MNYFTYVYFQIFHLSQLCESSDKFRPPTKAAIISCLTKCVYSDILEIFTLLTVAKHIFTRVLTVETGFFDIVALLLDLH